MNYHEAIAAIRNEASHIGRAMTRPEAANMLTGDARRACNSNNPLNSNVIGYRHIGRYVVEIALVDFTGMRGGGYSAGITVFGHHDLSECVDIGAVAAKLESLKEDA